MAEPESPETTQQRPSPHYGYWSAGVITFFLIVLAGAIVLLWIWGLLDKPENAERGDSLAALFALVGVVFTGSITLVGLLMRLTAQERVARNSDLELSRLRAETSLSAISYLDDRNSNEQRGGAVVALCTISQTELAVSLLIDLWPKKLVNTTAAIRVIEFALDDGRRDIAVAAADALESNAALLEDPTGGMEWPHQFGGSWDKTADPEVKYSMVRALLRAWNELKMGGWSQTYANPGILMLYSAFEQETDEAFKLSAAVAFETTLNDLHPNLKDGDRFTGIEIPIVHMRHHARAHIATALDEENARYAKSVTDLADRIDPAWRNRSIAEFTGHLENA